MKHNEMSIAQNMVSVVIPCYNAGKTLKETVESVFNQSYKNWEIIIVNDGSTDNSQQIAEKLAEKLAEIAEPGKIQIINIENGGVSNARNIGASASKGEYIAFLDADDIWYPEKLKKQVDFLVTHKDVGICFSKVRFTRPDGSSLNQYSSIPTKPLTPMNLIVENHLCTSSNIMCRSYVFSSVGGFEVGMNYAEDQEWLLKVCLYGQLKIMGIPCVLMDYRTQNGSLSSSLEKMEQGWRTLLEKVNHYAPEFVWRHHKEAEAIYLRYLARRALRQGEPAKVGLAYIHRSLESNWTILLTSPWRTIATIIGLLCWQIFPSKIIARIFRISQK